MKRKNIEENFMQIGTNRGSIATNAANTRILADNIDKNTNTIVRLVNDVGSTSDSLQELEDKVTVNEDALTTLQDKVTANEDAQTTLQDQFTNSVASLQNLLKKEQQKVKQL